MNLSVGTAAPAITVFFQGLLSFFSPCVLPLLPLYVGYLSGGAGKKQDEIDTARYPRGRMLCNTLFFVLGISFTFFVLGLGFTAAGRFFTNYQAVFARVGGILVILFGLYQLGLFGSSMLDRDHRLPFHLERMAMNPLTALLLGFTFSFAWTPCVGPALASVLLMAASASSSAAGFILIGVYTLGFTLPFLAVGLFTGALLDFFRSHRAVVRYTAKAGGVLMVVMGVMMFTGWMNDVTGYLSGLGAKPQAAPPASSSSMAPSAEASSPEEAPQGSEPEGEEASILAPGFVLTDQFGVEHDLSAYKGKTVFLNFWATWCPPCRAEMPDIQALYEEYGQNTGDLIILGVAGPNVGGEGSAQEIAAFLEEHGYTYPVVMDESGMTFNQYFIRSFPTTFMIKPDGTVLGYVPGQLTKDMMDSIIRQAMGET